MSLSRDVQLRCGRFFKGLWNLETLTLRDIGAALGLTSGQCHSTLPRMLHGFAPHRWTRTVLEQAVAYAAPLLKKSYGDVLAYLLGLPCEYALRYHEIESAHFLLPQPGSTRTLRRKLATFEAEARSVHIFERFLGPSQTPESVSKLALRERARVLGTLRPRILPPLYKFAADRRERFLRQEPSPARPALQFDLFLSDFEAVPQRRGMFRTLEDEGYQDWMTSLIHDSVKLREVKIGLIDDREANLPRRLLNAVEDYDSLGVIDGRFATWQHRGRLTRGWCEHTVGPSECNRHIDWVRGVLQELHGYVANKTQTQTQTVKALESYLL